MTQPERKMKRELIRQRKRLDARKAAAKAKGNSLGCANMKMESR